MVKCGFANFTVFSVRYKLTLFKITWWNFYADFGIYFPRIQSFESILKIFSLRDAVPVYFMNVHMDLQVNYVNEVEWSRLRFTIKCEQVKKVWHLSAMQLFILYLNFHVLVHLFSFTFAFSRTYKPIFL